MSDALEPSLMDSDRRLLSMVPECGTPDLRERSRDETRSIWGVCELLRDRDLAAVELHLRGLEHLGYVVSAMSAKLRELVWWRTPKGDDAVRLPGQHESLAEYEAFGPRFC